MPGLVQSLKIQDEGFLHIVAELWGIDISPCKESELVNFLTKSIIEKVSNPEIINEFPPDVQSALDDLISNQGAMPWSVFSHRHGSIRDMGAGRRDREKPYQNPTSPAEYLWYRGILFRAFQDTERGAEEFAYIPQELLSVIPQKGETTNLPPGRLALTDECQIHYLTNDSILDHTCTLLAALRLGYDRNQLEAIAAEWLSAPTDTSAKPYYLPTIEGLIKLLNSAKLLSEDEIPRPELTRSFLEAERGEALKQLFLSWKNSSEFNELRMIPNLIFEGKWQNDAQKSRQGILDFLSKIPTKTWWNIDSFIYDIKLQNPDFQRHAGEYDSWYIRSADTHGSLRGFEHWDDIEGALIRFTLCAPLHWLGIVDLASAKESSPILAFRITSWGDSLLRGQLPTGFMEEKAPVFAYADGRIRIPVYAPRAVRYQISRFCHWQQRKAEEYHYRITPESLESATKQGLRVDQFISLLQRHASRVPPNLIKALSRWEKFGCEARFEQVTVLRVRDAELIDKLKKSKAARFLGDSLGPTTIIIKPGGLEKVQGFLSEQGYLSKGSS